MTRLSRGRLSRRTWGCYDGGVPSSDRFGPRDMDETGTLVLRTEVGPVGSKEYGWT